VHGGKYGKVKLARAICYKRRKSIGPAGKNAIPSEIDYDLWHGPADIQESIRGNESDKVQHAANQGPVHYDWHWFWNYGGGDLCNQAIHEIDIARWFLGTHEVSPEVVSVGGRFGYVDLRRDPEHLHLDPQLRRRPAHHRSLRPDLRRQDRRSDEQVRQVQGEQPEREVGQVA
jgi:hypothetical protein